MSRILSTDGVNTLTFYTNLAEIEEIFEDTELDEEHELNDNLEFNLNTDASELLGYLLNINSQWVECEEIRISTTEVQAPEFIEIEQDGSGNWVEVSGVTILPNLAIKAGEIEYDVIDPDSTLSLTDEEVEVDGKKGLSDKNRIVGGWLI